MKDWFSNVSANVAGEVIGSFVVMALVAMWVRRKVQSAATQEVANAPARPMPREMKNERIALGMLFLMSAGGTIFASLFIFIGRNEPTPEPTMGYLIRALGAVTALAFIGIFLSGRWKSLPLKLAGIIDALFFGTVLIALGTEFIYPGVVKSFLEKWEHSRQVAIFLIVALLMSAVMLFASSVDETK